MATTGLTNLNYAIMATEDTATTAPVYATPKRLIGVNSVSNNPENESATLYGDNQALATVTKTKKITTTLEVARLPLEDRAALFGHSYNSETNVMSVSASDKPPYVAFMYDLNTDEGYRELHIFYKGKFTPSQDERNTEGESLGFDIHSIEGEFIYRLDNGKIEEVKIVADSDTITAASWFTSLNNA